jgi:lysophospholipase L1-like esterase
VNKRSKLFASGVAALTVGVIAGSSYLFLARNEPDPQSFVVPSTLPGEVATTAATNSPAATAVGRNVFGSNGFLPGWGSWSSAGAPIAQGGTATYSLSGGGQFISVSPSSPDLAFQTMSIQMVTADALWNAQLFLGEQMIGQAPLSFGEPDSAGIRKAVVSNDQINPKGQTFSTIYLFPPGESTRSLVLHGLDLVGAISPTDAAPTVTIGPDPLDPTATTAAPSLELPSAPTTSPDENLPPPVGCKVRPRLMPLGDSLTFGLHDLGGPESSEDSYRGHLYRTLKAQGFNVDYVGPNDSPLGFGGDPDHAGFGGYTIGPDDLTTDDKPGNIFERVERWLKDSKPNIILLSIGTNDLSAGDVPVTNPAEEVQKSNAVIGANLAALKLENLVRKIQRITPNAIIVVGDVPPSAGDPTRKREVNATAKRLGEADPNDRLLYAPIFDRMNADGYQAASDLADGTHYTVSGGQKFAKAWLPTVKRAIQMACM